VKLALILVGLAIVGGGVILVATHGVVAGVNLPSALGLPCQTPSNSTECLGFGGYSVGTIVVIFGFGLAAQGLRTPSVPKISGGVGPTVGMPPEAFAAIAAFHARTAATMPAAPPGPVDGVRYCPACGRPNANDARFCQRCGKTMPPPDPPAAPAPP
jgi:hypothetical protein